MIANTGIRQAFGNNMKIERVTGLNYFVTRNNKNIDSIQVFLPFKVEPIKYLDSK